MNNPHFLSGIPLAAIISLISGQKLVFIYKWQAANTLKAVSADEPRPWSIAFVAC